MLKNITLYLALCGKKSVELWKEVKNMRIWFCDIKSRKGNKSLIGADISCFDDIVKESLKDGMTRDILVGYYENGKGKVVYYYNCEGKNDKN